MDTWLKIMNELTSPRISPRLEDRIYQEILVKGEQFTQEKAGDFAVGIELLGKLILAHTDYTSKHPFGDMFGDYMVQQETTNSRCGQFFTPMPIAELIAEMSMPDLKPDGEPQRIIDPAAGTGRFMLATAKRYATATGQLNFIFYNVDIDFKVYVFCTMNAILTRIPSVNVWGDTLTTRYRESIVTIPLRNICKWKLLNAEETVKIVPQGGEPQTVRIPETPEAPLPVTPKKTKYADLTKFAVT
jgi:type I restriction-modification system DNA methylase subunit